MNTTNNSFSVEDVNILYTNARKIFFAGIGGISMSALATYAHFFGKEIFGYDKTRTAITKRLEEIGSIKYYSTPDNVEGMDLVVYSSAIDMDSFELKRARELKIPTISRALLLGCIASRYKHKIAIAGMHGKSTTTAMLFDIFTYAKRSPTVFCGALLKGFEFGGAIGTGDTVIFEACEYKNAFLSMPCDFAGVLNVDFDHPDFFSSMDEIYSSFDKFTRDKKKVFINADDKRSLFMNRENAVTFGIDNKADYMGKIIHSSGKNAFSVIKNGKELARVELSCIGKHFVYDALCAFAIACESNIAPCVIGRGLSQFKGIRRRMEFIKKTDTGMSVFEDYAHHPSEISCSLSTLKSMGFEKILCVFQPHTYSRTHFLYNEFKGCFSDTCQLVLLPIYPAREENIYGLDEERLALDFGGILIKDFCAAADYIKKAQADACVIMGAGDIYKIKKYL
ncbi:MAG: hypothetical protein IKB27_03350 [Clostridia bacterium]|nr:hypothetical protein [Clostridia bacterium]